MEESQAIVYDDGEIELKVSVDSETVWLNRQQISDLFDRDVKTIGKHINNVFKEGELAKNAVVAKFATTATDGKTYIGASLKDLGKKWFGFSKMNSESFEMMERLK